MILSCYVSFIYLFFVLSFSDYRSVSEVEVEFKAWFKALIQKIEIQNIYSTFPALPGEGLTSPPGSPGGSVLAILNRKGYNVSSPICSKQIYQK